MMLIDKKFIGDFLAFARSEAGYTQTYVAKQLGFTPQYLSNVERGVCVPAIEHYRDMGRIYGQHPEVMQDVLEMAFENELKKVRF